MLETINTILGNPSKKEVYKVSEEELKGILAGEEDFTNGRYITHEDFKKEIDEWLEAE